MKSGFLWMFVPLLAAQDGAVVEGTAFNRVTHTGVSGVTVKLAAASDSSKILHTVNSDATGAFRLQGLAGGDYVASYDAPGGFLAPSFWEPPCRPFHVAESGRAARLEVPLIPLATLRVRVVDGEGRPVPRVRVECFLATGGGGATGDTDAEGRFQEAGIAPGAYKLRARPVLPGTPLEQRAKQTTPLAATPPEGERWTWAPTYFPNTVEIAGAETIVVGEGADMPEYVIRLRAAPVYRLSGMVTDDEGEPAPGASVWLLSELGWGPGEARVVAGSDGSFEFPSVRAGEWQVVAESKRGETRFKGFTQLSMPRHDLEKLSLRITPPFPLDAVVEGLAPGAMRPSLALVPVAGPYEQEVSSDHRPDGTWQFEEVYPGRYRVAQPGELPGYYLKTILLGTQDVTGRDVDLTPQSPPLHSIYKANAPRAQGTVENGAGVKVVFVEAAQADYIPGQDVRVAVCDGEGHFTLEGLRPTAYYAFAFAIGGVNTDAVREAVFRLGLSQQAQTVRLEEGETANLALKITPFPLTLQRP